MGRNACARKHVFRVLKRGKPLARRNGCTHDACEASHGKQTVLVAIKGAVYCGPKSLAAEGRENQWKVQSSTNLTLLYGIF